MTQKRNPRIPIDYELIEAIERDDEIATLRTQAAECDELRAKVAAIETGNYVVVDKLWINTLEEENNRLTEELATYEAEGKVLVDRAEWGVLLAAQSYVKALETQDLSCLVGKVWKNIEAFCAG